MVKASTHWAGVDLLTEQRQALGLNPRTGRQPPWCCCGAQQPGWP
ncbi:hypothetical protein [Candidatus Synechococcus spongiarum]|nr:hypothetical protein [Candidatus Synechococcus spongiarum]